MEARSVINTFRTPEDRRWYRLTLAALILAAWCTLAIWGASPYAGLLDHATIGEATLSPALTLVVFVAVWTLMTVAMMLPGSLPLVNLFRRVVLDRRDGSRLVALLILGYLLAWTSFGLLAYAGDVVLHTVVKHVWGSVDDTPVIVSAILLLAGVYQFTPLKQLCLEQCRSPYGFLVQHWRSRAPALGALRLGARHGLYCVGCCWTLMLLMFAVGGANVGWMLALGTVMAAERTTRLGSHLSRPLGVALILWAGVHLAGLASLSP